MADPLSIVFRRPPGQPNAINQIILDATISERHDHSSEVTTHPIETGGFVADHIYENPRVVTIEGEITDSPIVPFNIMAGLSARRLEAYDQLVLIHKARAVVRLVTGLKVYADMVMRSLSVPRDPGTGGRLQFSAEFVEIRQVTSEVVGVATPKPEQKDKVVAEQSRGRQEVRPAPEAVAQKAEAKAEEIAPEKPKSILFELFK